MIGQNFQTQLKGLYQGGDQLKIEAFILDCLAEATAGGDAALTLCALYNELGGYYRCVSRYHDSLKAFDQAAAYLDAGDPGQSILAATVMINRAGTCRLMGDSAKAFELYRQAGKILDTQPEADPYVTASLHNNLSISYLEESRLEEALAEAQEGYALIRTLPGSEQEQATALTNLASIHSRAGDMKMAEAQIVQAITLYENQPNRGAHFSAALNLLAGMRAHWGDYAGARDVLLKALENTRRSFGENIEVAVTMQNLASICSGLGDTTGACRWQQDALKLMERLLGMDDAQTASARRQLTEYQAKG